MEVELGAIGTESKGTHSLGVTRKASERSRCESWVLKKELQLTRKRSWGLILSTQGDACAKARDRESKLHDGKWWEIRLEMRVGSELQKDWGHDEANGEPLKEFFWGGTGSSDLILERFCFPASYIGNGLEGEGGWAVSAVRNNAPFRLLLPLFLSLCLFHKGLKVTRAKVIAEVEKMAKSRDT